MILADGDFPSAPETLSALKEAEFLCCCDNAGKMLIEQLGIIPDAIIGDGDSLPQEFKERYKDIYHQVDEQEYNDLTKATRYCISQGYDHITYLGATGKREDHTLGNIALMAYYSRELHICPVMITDHGTFTVHHGDSSLSTFPRQQVSIFNLSCSRIESNGLRWASYPYRELWQGTLNEATSDEVSFNADGTYIVFRTHHPKS